MSEPTWKQRIFWFIRDIGRIIINIGGPTFDANSNVQVKNMRICRDGSVEKIWTHRPCEWVTKVQPIPFPSLAPQHVVSERRIAAGRGAKSPTLGMVDKEPEW